MKTKIYNDIVKSLKKINLNYNKNFGVEVPNIPEHGDFSSNVALVNTKVLKKKPHDIAKLLAEDLSKKRDYKSIKIAGPGFLNFKLATSLYYKELKKIGDAGTDYGKSDYGKSQKVLIEFISANPTGPLNVVSARAGAYGDSLYRIMDHLGFEPFREFYLNDAGNQVDILAESLEIRYRELHGHEVEEFPVEAYHGEYIKELAFELNTLEGTKLFHMTEDDRLERMKNFALDEIHKMQISSLKRFDVEFDNWMSEKKLRAEGTLEEALSYLAEAGCTYEKDDAVFFSSTKFGDEKDRVLIKADGNPTYLVPDIAYHLTKYNRGFNIILDVLGPDHHGHVSKLRAAIKALELDDSKLEIIYLQHINLLQDGEIVKMSKRTGKIITMDDLIDEVGKDAARYFFLDRRPSAHLDFDLELAKKKTSENPVFYCQYAYARINSVLKKAKKVKLSLKKCKDIKLKKLSKKDELDIIKKMLEFPAILQLCADNREPHRLAGYVHELASMFHKYYAKYKIIDEENPDLSCARLYLISAVQNVISISLGLMGISSPKKM
ncbi:MAG: arginine--tRNA ligase [Candidatus Cloacimonetes bacterium]|nr:arginine--tRNA ligase [Candidatus Cloacimonadota bacterium]